MIRDVYLSPASQQQQPISLVRSPADSGRFWPPYSRAAKYWPYVFIQRHDDQSRNAKLQLEVAAIIYRLMWREREYKYLPQYLNEKYK